MYASLTISKHVVLLPSLWRISSVFGAGFGKEIHHPILETSFIIGYCTSSDLSGYKMSPDKATEHHHQCKLSDSVPTGLITSLHDWQFAPSSVLKFQLPVDPNVDNYIRPNIKGVVFSKVKPTPLLQGLKIVAYSSDVLANILDMDPSITETEEFIEWVAGKNIINSSTPMAHRYGGHQFGYWAMQLGDGRAISLGEYISRNGKRWDIQLKGSGLTPYSRGGDGRAVLRSSVREFLCSEAMHALGVPTSRAAALVVSSDLVVRDQFYQGQPECERAAIVMRIAPSWLRFGSFEILARNHEFEELRKLLDYTIAIRSEVYHEKNDSYISLLEHICKESISLVVAWQSVGFTHGVLNTDNMSMFGVTIDYGPFGFMEAYDPGFTPNTSDSGGRYAYSEQIKILHWNLEKLGAAVWPLLTEPERKILKTMLERVIVLSYSQLGTVLYEKLGFSPLQDPNMLMPNLLLKMMGNTGSDFTMTFRQLGFVSFDQLSDPVVCDEHWALKKLRKDENYTDFLDLYKQQMDKQGLTDDQRRSNILRKNPQYVLRNWMAQQAIEKAENDDFSDVNFLMGVLKNPFSINEEAEKRGYSGPTPQWGCTIRVSCSS